MNPIPRCVLLISPKVWNIKVLLLFGKPQEEPAKERYFETIVLLFNLGYVLSH